MVAAAAAAALADDERLDSALALEPRRVEANGSLARGTTYVPDYLETVEVSNPLWGCLLRAQY